MTYYTRSIAPSDEIERLVHYMVTISEKSANEWSRTFAVSILRQSRRRNWKPSPKQLTMMRRLVSDLFAHGYGGGDIDVIED